MIDADQKYYDLVADELAKKVLQPGLWARALAEAGGDDSKARAQYIRLRVEDLRKGEKARRPKSERFFTVERVLVLLAVTIVLMFIRSLTHGKRLDDFGEFVEFLGTCIGANIIPAVAVGILHLIRRTSATGRLISWIAILCAWSAIMIVVR